MTADVEDKGTVDDGDDGDDDGYGDDNDTWLRME